MQMSGEKVFRKKAPPVQRSWGRSILVSLKQHQESTASAEGVRIESEGKEEGGSCKHSCGLLKISAFTMNAVGRHFRGF